MKNDYSVLPINFDEYVEAAQRTSSTIDGKEKLLNGLMGMCGEAGEAIDVMKKFMFQGHGLEVDHMLREIGDCIWYIAEAIEGLRVIAKSSDIEFNPSYVLALNIDKLIKRYPDSFKTEQSQHRADGDV